MIPRPLQLDYLRPSNRARLARYALAIVAIAFVLDGTWYYTLLRRDLSAAEAGLRRSPAAYVRVSLNRAVPADEISAARETVGLLSTPWEDLFGALEAAQTDRVALLAIEPDAGQRTVTIKGEAKDYLAAVSYMASLAGQKGLRGVHLVQHEQQKGSAQRPLAFSIQAKWPEYEP